MFTLIVQIFLIAATLVVAGYAIITAMQDRQDVKSKHDSAIDYATEVINQRIDAGEYDRLPSRFIRRDFDDLIEEYLES